MIVRIGGQVIEEPKMNVEVRIIEDRKEIEKIQKMAKKILPVSMTAGAMNMAKTAFAAGVATNLGDKLMPLVHLLQDFALPLGIGVATWGLIEVIIGNPAGKQKIKGAVIGFIGIFIIPFVFFAIRDAFQNN